MKTTNNNQNWKRQLKAINDTGDRRLYRILGYVSILLPDLDKGKEYEAILRDMKKLEKDTLAHDDAVRLISECYNEAFPTDAEIISFAQHEEKSV